MNCRAVRAQDLPDSRSASVCVSLWICGSRPLRQSLASEAWSDINEDHLSRFHRRLSLSTMGKQTGPEQQQHVLHRDSHHIRASLSAGYRTWKFAWEGVVFGSRTT
jgi:hypothetical protein